MFIALHATATPAREDHEMAAQRQSLTVDAVCTELDISRRTFYEWRAKGRAPRCIKLPNGSLRIRRIDFDDWLESCEEAA